MDALHAPPPGIPGLDKNNKTSPVPTAHQRRRRLGSCDAALRFAEGGGPSMIGDVCTRMFQNSSAEYLGTAKLVRSALQAVASSYIHFQEHRHIQLVSK